MEKYLSQVSPGILQEDVVKYGYRQDQTALLCGLSRIVRIMFADLVCALTICYLQMEPHGM